MNREPTLTGDLRKVIYNRKLLEKARFQAYKIARQIIIDTGKERN